MIEANNAALYDQCQAIQWLRTPPQPSYPTKINTYDIDGVIWLPPPLVGLKPDVHDIIITGRSYEEEEETYDYLESRGIYNEVWFQQCRFHEKTRASSGYHKAAVLSTLLSQGFKVGCHFEDDPVQARIIRNSVPEVQVIEIVHDLIERENIRQGDRNWLH